MLEITLVQERTRKDQRHHQEEDRNHLHHHPAVYHLLVQATDQLLCRLLSAARVNRDP